MKKQVLFLLSLFLFTVVSSDSLHDPPLVLWVVVDGKSHRGVLRPNKGNWSWSDLAEDKNARHVGTLLCIQFAASLQASLTEQHDGRPHDWCDPDAVGNEARKRAIALKNHLEEGNKMYAWWNNGQLFDTFRHQHGIPLFLGLKCFDERYQYGDEDRCIPTAFGHRPSPTIWEWLTRDGANAPRYNGWKEFWQAVNLRNRLIERFLKAYGVKDDEYFDMFAKDSTFSFVGNHPSLPHDEESVRLARSINAPLANQLLSLKEPMLGMAGVEELFLSKHPIGHVEKRTQNTCRHTLFLTMLLTEMQKEVLVENQLSQISVIEIGGGYGNIARMMWETKKFKSWKIFDLALVSRLQNWWLTKSQLSGDGRERITLLADHELHEWIFHQQEEEEQKQQRKQQSLGLAPNKSNVLNVLVATHSWSEMDLSKWFMYFNALVRGKKKNTIGWILYAYQLEYAQLDHDATKMKMKVLLKYYDIKNSVMTENGDVRILVLRKKENK
jgi:hypothetical protein